MPSLVEGGGRGRLAHPLGADKRNGASVDLDGTCVQGQIVPVVKQKSENVDRVVREQGLVRRSLNGKEPHRFLFDLCAAKPGADSDARLQGVDACRVFRLGRPQLLPSTNDDVHCPLPVLTGPRVHPVKREVGPEAHSVHLVAERTAGFGCARHRRTSCRLKGKRLSSGMPRNS